MNETVTPKYCHRCGHKLKKVTLQCGESLMHCKPCGEYFKTYFKDTASFPPLKTQSKEMINAKEKYEKKINAYHSSQAKGTLLPWIIISDIILFFWAATEEKLIPMIGSLLFILILWWTTNE